MNIFQQVFAGVSQKNSDIIRGLENSSLNKTTPVKKPARVTPMANPTKLSTTEPKDPKPKKQTPQKPLSKSCRLQQSPIIKQQSSACSIKSIRTVAPPCETDEIREAKKFVREMELRCSELEKLLASSKQALNEATTKHRDLEKRNTELETLAQKLIKENAELDKQLNM